MCSRRGRSGTSEPGPTRRRRRRTLLTLSVTRAAVRTSGSSRALPRTASNDELAGIESAGLLEAPRAEACVADGALRPVQDQRRSGSCRDGRAWFDGVVAIVVEPRRAEVLVGPVDDRCRWVVVCVGRAGRGQQPGPLRPGPRGDGASCSSCSCDRPPTPPLVVNDRRGHLF